MCASVTRFPPTPAAARLRREVGQVLSARVDWRNMGELKPLLHVVDRFLGGCRMDEHPGVSHQPHEAGRYDPRDADSLYAVDQALPPASGGVVIRRSAVVGVDQQVEVGDYHPALGPAKSSASNWSLSWFSFSGSTPGTKPLWIGTTLYSGAGASLSAGDRPRRKASVDHLLERSVQQPRPLFQGVGDIFVDCQCRSHADIIMHTNVDVEMRSCRRGSRARIQVDYVKSRL